MPRRIPEHNLSLISPDMSPSPRAYPFPAPRQHTSFLSVSPAPRQKTLSNRPAIDNYSVLPPSERNPASEVIVTLLESCEGVSCQLQQTRAKPRTHVGVEWLRNKSWAGVHLYALLL